MRLFKFVIFLSVLFECSGQGKPLLYNVDELPQTLFSNPGAEITFKGHIGVPLASYISFSGGFTGANLYDIFGPGGYDINSRVTSTIRRLSSDDYFTTQEQLSILDLGWRLNQDNYLFAGIYQELDAFAYFPRDAAILLNEGNRDYINEPFDFSQIAFTGEVLSVYHIGLNRRINRRLTIGGRIKLYAGIFNVESIDNTGFFVSSDTPGGVNYYKHVAENINLRANTSGFASLGENTIQENAANLFRRSLLGGNKGLGIDLGATYVLSENLTVSGAVQDVGMIHNTEDVENYLYYGSYETSGIEPLFSQPGESAIPYWDIFEDELETNLIDETLNEAYTTWRPFKLNAGLVYKFQEIFLPCDYRAETVRKYRSSAGFHVFGINRPRGLKYAVSGYYDRKISQNTRMRVAYTIDDFTYTNLGFMVSTNVKNFNFYLAANNLFGYFDLAKSNSGALQLGLQYIFKTP